MSIHMGENKMKLTPRLQTIANLVPKSQTVADVGTDHGYIPVYLIENEIANRVIAADINEGPLKSAEKTIELYKFQNQIETRLGNGLEVLKIGEADVVIIAGMGGLLIRDILAANEEITKSISTFILQPMVAQDELRFWLEHHGFRVTQEKLAKEEHRIYEILVVEKGIEKIDDPLYYDIGKRLIESKDPLLVQLIEKHIRKQNKIISSLLGQDNEELEKKLKECKEKVKKLEEVLKCLNSAQQS